MHGHSVAVGAVVGLASMAIPDGVCNFLLKLAMGVIVAVVSSVVAEVVKRLFKRK